MKLNFFSPGRVNLIGEHIDYSGGNVLPVAIDIGTYGEVTKRDDKIITLTSKNFPKDGIITLNVDDIYEKENNWTDYVRGVLNVMREMDFANKVGFDLVVEGNIPNSSGLSSSASLEVLIAHIVKRLNSYDISNKSIALISQKAENEFVGVNCGIMDQFIIANGVVDKALKLNTETLDFELVNFVLKEHKLVVLNSNKKRGLVDSEYNNRRRECEQVLKCLKTKYDISELCQANMQQLDSIKEILTSDEYKRGRHAILEQVRVNKSVECLNNNDLIGFGNLMYQSHTSLKDDYEVSCQELDVLVASAKELGCIGARMTGAGFGGCAICLVANDFVDEFIEKMTEIYKKECSLNLECYVVVAKDGVHDLDK